jgi:branched-chain amino acid transport system permease protein
VAASNGGRKTRRVPEMLEFLQQAINGLSVGCIYGLVALGFVLIYKASEIVNFAQGDLLMLGAFLGWTFIAVVGLDYWLGFALAIAATAAAGFLLDRQVMRPIIGQPQFAGIMLTIGIAFTIRGLVIMIWGPQERSFVTPFTQRTTEIGGLVLSDVSLSIIAGTILLSAALYLFFRHTRLGVAMQAASPCCWSTQTCGSSCSRASPRPSSADSGASPAR